MEAKEIRLGNYVLDGTDIIKLDKESFICTLEDNCVFDPIELTEELLLRAGFEKYDNGWFSLRYFTDCKEVAEEMEISYNLSSGRYSVTDYDEDEDTYPIYTSKVIRHLHIFQNTTQVLTGKELTLK